MVHKVEADCLSLLAAAVAPSCWSTSLFCEFAGWLHMKKIGSPYLLIRVSPRMFFFFKCCDIATCYSSDNVTHGSNGSKQ
jgi:hypothetical protein